MSFRLPDYHPPDFTAPALRAAPPVRFQPAPAAGVAPEDYHATSVFPEYFQLAPGRWQLLAESRMDCVVVRRAADVLAAVEFRHLQVGDLVACGRREDGEDGILVHTQGFAAPRCAADKFAFRTGLSRESAFSADYDELYALLRHERDHGQILWVLGPALAFDRDARAAFVRLVEAGYVHGLLAGNALPTHDLEGALYGTALGHALYGRCPVAQGHYRHLDVLNRVRATGSLAAAVAAGLVPDGIMRALLEQQVPYVLAGSIRDDGPLPEVIGDVYAAQDAMRALTRQATTVICLATQLHTIATGNLVPSYRVAADGRVRPVFFYSVDMSEFAMHKLADRGSLTARAILTNVQDFVVTLQRGLQAPPD